MKLSKTSAHSGFTLIELLVVIVIIAVLAGLIFPVMGKVRLRGVETRTMSNLRQVAAAMGSYASDNDSLLPGPLSVEQYPTFGIDPKRDEGSLARLLATYLGLPDRKAADKGQAVATDVLACPMSSAPADDVKLDDIPGYIMNMELIGDYAQPAWGETKGGKPPLSRAALGSWRELKEKTDVETPTVNLARRWAMRHTDQKDCEKLAISGDWVEKLPKEPVFEDRYITLFFDMHVESYKPVYEEK